MSLFKRNVEVQNLFILCDQKGRNTFDKHITFLNQKVDNFHSSPVVLSKELELPIYFVFCKYDFDNVCFSHKIQKLEFLPEDSTYDITQKIATRFTEEILNQPEQYLWAHNRFNI
jgi:lauroyl/myristoyl acyltransferase